MADETQAATEIAPIPALDRAPKVDLPPVIAPDSDHPLPGPAIEVQPEELPPPAPVLTSFYFVNDGPPAFVDEVKVDASVKTVAALLALSLDARFSVATVFLTRAKAEAALAKVTGDRAAAMEATRISQLRVSPLQIRLAANRLGVRDAIEAVVADAATPRDIKDMWEYSTEYSRANPAWGAFAPLIGKASADIDALFSLAETL